MGDGLRGLIDVGAIILVNVGCFAFVYGKLTQRLDDHITLVSRWQEQISSWQRTHVEDSKKQAELVARMERLQERQQVITEFMQKNLEKINANLWP